MAATATAPKNTKTPAKPRAPKGTQGKSASGQILTLKRNQIVVREGFNPRTAMEQEKLQDLAQALRARGILTPCLVRPGATGGKYFLLGGHRRLAAAELAGVDEIPCIVRDEATELEDAVADNFNRADLNPLEEAQAFARLIKDKGLTAKGVAEAVGVAQRRVTERLRILDTPKPLHEHFGTGKLSAQAAKPLAEITEFDAKLGLAVGKRAIDRGGTLNDASYEAGQAVLHPGAAKLGHLAAVRLGGYGTPTIDTSVLGTLPKDLAEKVAKMDAAAKKAYYGNSYGPKLTEASLDALRAAGVVYAPKGGGDSYNAYAVIKDPEVMREVLIPVIERDFKAFVREDATRRAAAAKGPDAAAKADDAAREYQLGLAARAYNLKLGEVLMGNFATVELTADVVKFLAMAPSLDRFNDGSSLGQAVTLFQSGLRYIDPQWQTEKLVKSTGRTKVTYASAKSGSVNVTEAFAGWYGLATTAQEIAGRTVVAYAAAIYAKQDVVSSSQRVYRGYQDNHAILPESAEKLLKTIVGKKIPKWTAPRAPKAAGTGGKEGAPDEGAPDPARKLLDDLTLTELAVLTAFAAGGVSIGASEDVMVGSIVKTITPKPTKTQVKDALRRMKGMEILQGVMAGGMGLTAQGYQVAKASGSIIGADVMARFEGKVDKVLPQLAKDVHLVAVRSTVDSSETVQAELCDDPAPAGRDVRKVIYVDSRTSAWVASSRIVDPQEQPELTDLQLRVLRYFLAGGTKAALRTETEYRKAFSTTSGAAGAAIAGLLKLDLLGGDQLAPHITKRGGEILDALAKADKAAA